MARQIRQAVRRRRPIAYTSADAKYILETGNLAWLEKFPRPVNDTGFYLVDLPGRPFLDWPPTLPDVDPRGHPNATEFEGWKKAQASKVGIAGNFASIKGRGNVACHSNLERRLLFCFEMNPYVVEIRTQYPEWNSELYWTLKEQGLRMRKRDLMTIDFLLTLKIPGLEGFHYHAVSCKPYQKLIKGSVKRRHKREVAALAKWGCTHEVMTEHSVTNLEDENNERLHNFMSRSREDITLYTEATIRFADYLLSIPFGGTADRLVGIVCKQFRWSLRQGYRYLALAHFRGLLEVDHMYPLLPDARLVVRPPRYR